MQNERKKLEELNLLDDFLFNAMMTYPEMGEDFGKLKRVYVIFICNYDPFGYDRVKYTIRNMCVEEPEMPYDDGAQTTVLYTKGTKGDGISEELRQFLNYMENTTQTNAVNDTLKDIQKMVDIVKRDGEVSLSYMKGFERDTIMYEKGQEAERQNTERERQRADSAEKARMIAEEEKIKAQKETAEALKRVAELEDHIGVWPCVQQRVYSPVGGSPIK